MANRSQKRNGCEQEMYVGWQIDPYWCIDYVASSNGGDAAAAKNNHFEIVKLQVSLEGHRTQTHYKNTKLNHPVLMFLPRMTEILLLQFLPICMQSLMTKHSWPQ